MALTGPRQRRSDCVEQQPVETTVYSLSDTPPAPTVERRETERHMTLFRVGSIAIGDRRELCLIKNVSGGGMRIRAYCSVDVGARVEIELKCGVPIAGQVNWVDGTDAGITFDEAIDVFDILNTSMKGSKPRMPRVEVDCTVGLREGAQQWRVSACDVSQGGLKVRSGAVLAPGSEIVATLPDLAPIPGTVCWCDGGYIGLTFNSPIPLETLVRWIRARHERTLRAS